MNNHELTIQSFFDSFESTLQTKVYITNKTEYFSMVYCGSLTDRKVKTYEIGCGKSAVNFLYDRNFDLFTTLLIEDSVDIIKGIKADPQKTELWLPFYNLAREIFQNGQIHPYYFPILEAIVNAYKHGICTALNESLSDDYFKHIGLSYVLLKEKITKLIHLFDQKENAQAVVKWIFEIDQNFLSHPINASTEFVATKLDQGKEEIQIQSIVYPRTPEDFFYCLTPKILESNLRFKRCENCMRYFVTTSQSNARFCEHRSEETGRTCRQLMPKVHLLEKSKQDPAEWLYNRAYKTMYSRVTSGAISKGMYKEWSKAARAKRNECSKGLLTPEEYSSWLCDNGLFIDYLKEK